MNLCQMSRASVFAVFAVGLTFQSLNVRAEKNLPREAGAIRYSALTHELKSLSDDPAGSPGISFKLTAIGKSVQGRSIWMESVQTATQQSAPQHKVVLYICRQHGHEPASTQGALELLRAVHAAKPGSVLFDALQRVDIHVIPMANPDGSEAFLRHNAHNIDLNRDWLLRTQPESRALWHTLMELHPDIATDQHELYPTDRRGDFTETAKTGSLSSPAVIAVCANLQNFVAAYMAQHGDSTTEHWIDDDHVPRLAHRYGCVVAGIPTILFETARPVNARRSLATRANAQYEFMNAVLEFAAAADADAEIARPRLDTANPGFKSTQQNTNRPL